MKTIGLIVLWIASMVALSLATTVLVELHLLDF
jgi:hypothetical protein